MAKPKHLNAYTDCIEFAHRLSRKMYNTFIIRKLYNWRRLGSHRPYNRPIMLKNYFRVAWRSASPVAC
jgi:hypothetical protein